MKISVSSYSFSQYIAKGILTQFTCIQKARELGFDAIEFTDLVPPQGESVADYARRIRKECDRVGLPISCYTVYAELLNRGDEEVDRVKGQVDIAGILGVPCMRHDATRGYVSDRSYRGFDTALPVLAKRCREIAEYAKSKGIKTMVENHGYFVQDPERVEKLINHTASNNFGWLCDMGNFLCADCDPEKAVGIAAPYVFYAHAKDFHVKSGMLPDPGEGFFTSRAGNYLRGAIIGHGDVPVKQCLKLLKANGYNGYIGVEFEGLEDCIQGLSIGLANLRRYLAEIYGG